MEMRKEMRRIVRREMRGGRERLTVLLGKEKVLVIYHDNLGWTIGNAKVGKLASYSYFKFLVKREFGREIKNSQIRWLYNHLKRKWIRKGGLGSRNDLPDLLRRREREEGRNWGRWENRQFARLRWMDGKGRRGEMMRKVVMGLINDIYREEYEGKEVFVSWSPKEENLGGGGNPPPHKENPNIREGRGESMEEVIWR